MTSFTNAVTGLVKGKVQGVCFRTEAQKKARNFALTGWVRNTDDGDVEVLIAGNKPVSYTHLTLPTILHV